MTDKLYDWQISYWQHGCNDAKAGRPFDETLRYENGYENGFYWGQHGKSKYESENWQFDEPCKYVRPDPPLKNPYMEAIENIESILQRLHTFTKEFPESIDNRKKENYIVNLLKIRDELSEMRQQEMTEKL